MLPTSTLSAASRVQLTLTIGRSTLVRFALPSLPSFTSPPSSSLTPALSTATASPSSSPSSQSLAGLLWDGLLRAVPKKKVSHSRKSMRSANKGLKDRVDLVHCSACGRAKAQHHICAFCYAELNRARKVALKQEGEAGR